MMPLGIDPRIDFAFKLVFGSPDHTRITVHFLNAVLQFPQPITSVEILNPLQGKDRSEDKLVVLDILAEDAAGRRYNIEMQTTLPPDLAQRLTFYNCINLVRQLAEGEPYSRLRPAISICVLDRILFRNEPEYHLSFRLRCDQHASLAFSDDLVFHVLELLKYDARHDNVDSLEPLEKWLYFLKHAAELDADDLADRLIDDEYREAAGVLNMISQSPEDRLYYESRMKFLRDQEAQMAAAREEGRQEGRQEGREEGLLVGKIQTLQELLGDKVSGKQDLVERSPDQLTQMVADLQSRLRLRG